MSRPISHCPEGQNNLAAACESVGDLGRAIPLCEAALANCERVLGPEHPTSGIVRRNLETARNG
ncbi:tetratricopeptide repeat protein [Micromonospora sp. NPDC049114]|uniref:Tetratricopeptide repeat protein n=1 Tax=Micromonospora parastrephiae TaxID=2806101 RepID=A0ABS1XT92_9ACTN|nr:tetratricopeptide repeat protein [Micromonospora parastrephiae]MBM0232486.1 tetratricopeptide repeat protein [Micromonospora parastrephiae]